MGVLIEWPSGKRCLSDETTVRESTCEPDFVPLQLKAVGFEIVACPTYAVPLYELSSSTGLKGSWILVGPFPVRTGDGALELVADAIPSPDPADVAEIFTPLPWVGLEEPEPEPGVAAVAALALFDLAFVAAAALAFVVVGVVEAEGAFRLAVF